MNRAAHARLSLEMGLVFLVGGLGIAAATAVAGAMPSLFPFLLAAAGLPPLAIGLLGRRPPAPGTEGSLLLRRSGAVSAAWLLAVLLGFGLSIGRESEERFEMSWSFDADDRGVEDRNRVLLEFVDHPGWVSKIHSRDLGEYLQSLGTDRVPVTFLVTRDFGWTRGFIEVQVGERRAWKDLGGGGFSRRGTPRSRAAGGIGPSPFR